MSACPLPNEEERDNFFCLTCLLFDIGKKTLQTNFKKTWPLVNGTEAAWSDVPDDGAQLLALCDGLEIEDHEKNVIQKGDSTDWNLALVNKVLMHSRFRATQGSVVPDSQEYKGLDEIKGISSTLMSHAKEKVLPNSEFLAVWKKASDILEKFGATNEEIAAIQKDMERTRKEAEQYLQRLFPSEQNEKELVKSDQTVAGRIAKVVFDFNARQDDELSLKVDETVEILSEVSDEWWEGRLDDKAGMFPSNHVELLCETIAQAKEDRVAGRKAKVMFDFKAEEDDELSLKVDEIVAIHREVSQEWWEGRLHNNTGIFPSSHVQLLKEAKVQANEIPQMHRSTLAGGRAKVACDFKVGEVAGMRAKVVFDYKAGDDDELSLTVDEIVEVLGVSEQWWEGRLHDITGIFPSNHVELLEEAKAQAKEIPEENRLANRKAKVMFDFKAEEDGELSLKVDEIVELFGVSEEWWEGRLHNITGIFPSNYVELLEENRVPCRRAKVVFDYKAGDDDELNLKVGEIVEILAEVSKEWWEGRLHNNTGMFPSNFVELLEEATVQAKEIPEENQARGKEEHEYDDIVSVLLSCDSE